MKISFIIPFHNEEKNAGPMIEQVVKYAQKMKWNFEIIPVNDRSSDTTKEVLKTYAKKWKSVKPIERKEIGETPGNTMGKALLEGTRKSTGEIIIWTMGDLADEPATYRAIVDKINKGYDMVFGSRYMPGGSWGNLDKVKALLSSWGTRLAQLLFGVPVHDITNAFRGFRKDLIQHITLASSGFSISPEFAIKAHLAGYRLGQVPTVYYNRKEGVSSFKLWRMAITYLGVFMILLQDRLRGKPYGWQH